MGHSGKVFFYCNIKLKFFELKRFFNFASKRERENIVSERECERESKREIKRERKRERERDVNIIIIFLYIMSNTCQQLLLFL